MPGLIISVTRTLLFQEKPFVFRLKNRGVLVLVSFFFSILFNLASCKAEQIFNLSREELEEKLKNGDIAFVLEADPAELQKFARLYPSASFYAGLLLRSVVESENFEASLGDKAGGEAISYVFTLFEAALASPGLRIRESAAQELLLPVLERKPLAHRIQSYMKHTSTVHKTQDKTAKDMDLSQDNPLVTLEAAALYTLGHFNEAMHLLGSQKVPSSWDRAITMLTALSLQQGGSEHESSHIQREFQDFFLSSTTLGKAHTWAFREIQRQSPDFLTEAETAAIAGRLGVSNASYIEGLRYFRLVLKQDRDIFFQYPELTADLGRTFQYTGAQAEGIKLFLEWDRVLQTGSPPDNERTKGTVPHIRYRLLYFAGRLERQRRNYTKAVEYFNAALAFAPDALQEDACMWYILHTTWMNKPEDLIPLLYTYLPRWHDPSYFTDILDLLCSYFVANQQWKSMLEIFSRIRLQSNGEARAKYAYILGRAVSEGYIPVMEALNVLQAADMGGLSPEAIRKTTLAHTFFRIALEERQASLYYRALSAFRLGDKLLPMPVKAKQTSTGGEQVNPKRFSHPDEMELLLGFFEFGAASYAIPYIKNVQDALSIPELQVIAETLARHKQWIGSIRIVSAYIEREHYEISYEDLLLYYPRPFMEIIEANAQETGIPLEILYGLIRTESAFDPTIVSIAGAVGLSQLMPKTAEGEAGRIKKQGGPDYLDNLDLRNPAINVHIGASYLSYLISLMESPMQALLAYNGGYNRVRRWRTAKPELPEDLFLETIELTETREYGKRVLAAAAAYGYLYFDLSIETIVADIFK